MMKCSYMTSWWRHQKYCNGLQLQFI